MKNQRRKDTQTNGEKTYQKCKFAKASPSLSALNLRAENTIRYLTCSVNTLTYAVKYSEYIKMNFLLSI